MTNKHSTDEHGDQDARGAESHGSYGPAAVRKQVQLGDVHASDMERVRELALGTGLAAGGICGVANLELTVCGGYRKKNCEN